MECNLKRYLLKNETVHHLDGDVSNNILSNLRVLDRRYHCSIDSLHNPTLNTKCIHCGKDMCLNGAKLSRAIFERKRGKTGPFCSKKCSGLYGALVQNNKIDRYPIIPIVLEKNKINI